MASKSKFKILNELTIGSPCQAEDFSRITEPRDRGWYCNHCEKRVHDFSRLSKAEIVKLVEESGGDLCASIARRPDGSIITSEPPSRSLFSAGVFLASTAMLASSASAQSAPQASAPQHSGVENTISLGGVANIEVAPSPTPSPTATPLAPVDKAQPDNVDVVKGKIAATPPVGIPGRVAFTKDSNNPKSPKSRTK